MSDGTLRKTGKKDGVIFFYVVVVFLFFAQDVITHGLLFVGDKWLHINGVLFAWAVFVVVGSALGILTLSRTQPDQQLDPLMRAGRWLWRRLGWFGFVIEVLLAGYGISVLVKVDGHRRPILLCVVASVLYASVWIPIYTITWR